MNQKGFSLVEVMVGLGLLGVITYFSVSGVRKLGGINENVQAELDARYLAREVQDALGDFTRCQIIMSKYIPNINSGARNASMNGPLMLTDFQATLKISPQFNTPRLIALNRKVNVKNARLIGSPLNPVSGLGKIFEDNSEANTGVPKNVMKGAGEILSGVIGLQFNKDEGLASQRGIDRWHYMQIYFFIKPTGEISRCTTSPEKFQVIQSSCNSLGGILAFDGCRAAVFKSCDPSLPKDKLQTCMNEIARKNNLPIVEYAPVLGSGQSVFCQMEKMIKSERPSLDSKLCP